MEKGDKVRYLGMDRPAYDGEGNLMNEDLEVGKYYTVESSGCICIEIFGKMRLKEYFRKI